MEESSTLQQIQYEVELIKSMYGGEVEDLRVDASSSERQYLPPSVRLHLTPLQTHSEKPPESHIMCTIRLDTDNEYPHSAARYTLEECRGISDQERDEVLALLDKETKKAAGEGMVVFTTVCQTVKAYLQDHYRPDRPSVYDEMVARREAEARLQEENERKEQRRREEELQLQAERREQDNELFMNEYREERREAAQSRDRSAVMRSVSAVDGDFTLLPTSPARLRSSSSMSECSSLLPTMALVGSGRQEKVVEVVQRMSEENTDKPHSTFEVVDRSTHAKSVLHTWEVNLHRPVRRRSKAAKDKCLEDDTRLSDFNKKLAAVEKEMTSLLKLSSDHVVVYEAYKIERTGDCVKVHLLQPFIYGPTLSYFIEHPGIMSEGHLRFTAQRCVVNLAYLHKNNVVHRDLRDSCIYPYTNPSMTSPIADYSVERRLLEAIMDYKNKEPSNLYPAPPGKGGQKHDVFRLGVILISIFRGRRVQEISPDVPRRLCPEFRDFLKQCLHADEAQRWSADRLLGHELFSEQIGSTLSYLKSSNEDLSSLCETCERPKRRRDSNKPRQKPEAASAPPRTSLSDEFVHDKSRLYKDYEILELIGKGGFGRVYKVRNLVDRRKYALKRIILEDNAEDQQSRRILREVQCLSSLCNEHVVRYYTSWIEEFTEGIVFDGSESEDSDSEDDQSSSPNKGPQLKISKSQGGLSSMSFHDDLHLSSDDSEEDSDFVVFESSDETGAKQDFSSSSSSSLPSVAAPRPKEVNFQHQQKKKCLFIQMEYCENRTLEQAIHDGLHTENARLWRLFREIVRGLDYIHSLDLVHRDLKPGNIFIDSQDHVKIGDFGLAIGKASDVGAAAGALCTLSGTDTGNAGTYFYMAPQATVPSSKSRCSPKLDIYSLGIIFFEMVYGSTTGHERIVLLSKLRTPQIQLPPLFEETRFAKKKKLVIWLLNHDPDARPSAAELLKSDILPPLTTEEQKFKEKLDIALSKHNSDTYLDILRTLFNPKELSDKEWKFMHMNKSTHKNLNPEQIHFANEHIERVFKAHGGIWLPADIFIPKGSFYNDQDPKKLFSVVSETGNPMTFAPELRYPFARLAAIQKIQDIRRFCIDRVHRPAKLLADFPLGRYECAFDFVGKPREKVEFCARVMKIVQDVMKPLADVSTTFGDVCINVAYLPIAEVILSSCGFSQGSHRSVLAIIKDGLKDEREPTEICDALVARGCDVKACNALQRFIALNDSADSVLTQLLAKGFAQKRFRAELEANVGELRKIIFVAESLGVEYKMFFRPLVIPDDRLYKGFMCQFMLTSPTPQKKKQKTVILAQGGEFEHLIYLHRGQLPPSQVGDTKVSAVGMSLSLDSVASAVFSSRETPLPPRPDLKRTGCGGSPITVLIVYVGDDTQLMPRLRELVDMVSTLRSNDIAADFTQIVTMDDLEKCMVPYLVVLNKNKQEKVVLKHSWSRRGFWSNEKRVAMADVLEVLQGLMASDQERGALPVITSPSSKTEETIVFEVLPRKASKQKDSLRNDEQTRREKLENAMSRWTGYCRGPPIVVFCVELERDDILQLATVELENGNKNFNVSLGKLKERNQGREDVDYLCTCATAVFKKVESAKFNGRLTVVVAYSIPNDFFKRLW